MLINSQESLKNFLKSKIKSKLNIYLPHNLGLKIMSFYKKTPKINMHT
jgi:hypothetical protein